MTGSEIYCKVCTVDSVDEKARTVDCTPLDESAPLVGVNLQANQEGDTGVVCFPAVGSYVIVAFITPAVAAVVLCDKIDKARLSIGKTRITVCKMDDAAFAESVFFKHMLHDLVVVVCVDAKMGSLRLAEIQHVSQKSVHLPVTCDHVDHAVRGIG